MSDRDVTALPLAEGETPNVLVGLLGWSNKRNGVEFYRWDDKIIPRHGSEWGDLLAYNEAIAKAEGAPVIVVALPRATTPEQVHEAANRIHEVFGG